MTLPKFTPLLSTLVAGFLLATPSTGLCDRKITVVRDRDGDGHYNKKTYEVSNHHQRGDYRGGYYGRRPYYSGGYGPRSYSRYGSSYYGSSYYGSNYYRSRPSVTVVYRGAPAYEGVSDDLAVDVQRALRRRGLYRGSIDGDVGPGTRAAIRDYQYERGLTVTGRIDTRLLRALGIS